MFLFKLVIFIGILLLNNFGQAQKDVKKCKTNVSDVLLHLHLVVRSSSAAIKLDSRPQAVTQRIKNVLNDMDITVETKLSYVNSDKYELIPNLKLFFENLTPLATPRATYKFISEHIIYVNMNDKNQSMSTFDLSDFNDDIEFIKNIYLSRNSLTQLFVLANDAKPVFDDFFKKFDESVQERRNKIKNRIMFPKFEVKQEDVLFLDLANGHSEVVNTIADMVRNVFCTKTEERKLMESVERMQQMPTATLPRLSMPAGYKVNLQILTFTTENKTPIAFYNDAILLYAHLVFPKEPVFNQLTSIRPQKNQNHYTILSTPLTSIWSSCRPEENTCPRVASEQPFFSTLSLALDSFDTQNAQKNVLVVLSADEHEPNLYADFLNYNLSPSKIAEQLLFSPDTFIFFVSPNGAIEWKNQIDLIYTSQRLVQTGIVMQNKTTIKYIMTPDFTTLMPFFQSIANAITTRR